MTAFCMSAPSRRVLLLRESEASRRLEIEGNRTGTPGGIRTPNLLIRSYLLEPELGLISIFYQGFVCQE